MFNESNQPNESLRTLLGVNQTALDAPSGAQIGFIKQDVPFAEPLAMVDDLPVFGVVSRITPEGAQAVSTFADGSPAVTERAVGKGHAIYCAFLPSLSYYKPAIPLRPVDRGSSDEAMAHFLPTRFDPAAADLIARPLRAAKVQPIISASAPLVETSVIEADTGTAVVVTNWTREPLPGLRLTVRPPVAGTDITLAGGGKVAVDRQQDAIVLTFDLDVADVVILR